MELRARTDAVLAIRIGCSTHVLQDTSDSYVEADTGVVFVHIKGARRIRRRSVKVETRSETPACNSLIHVSCITPARARLQYIVLTNIATASRPPIPDSLLRPRYLGDRPLRQYRFNIPIPAQPHIRHRHLDLLSHAGSACISLIGCSLPTLHKRLPHSCRR